MTNRHRKFAELTTLIEALCENRITPGQVALLEEIVLNDAEARRYYLDYIDLHGSLYWDTAIGDESDHKDLPVSVAGSSAMSASFGCDLEATLITPPMSSGADGTHPNLRTMTEPDLLEFEAAVIASVQQAHQDSAEGPTPRRRTASWSVAAVLLLMGGVFAARSYLLPGNTQPEFVVTPLANRVELADPMKAGGTPATGTDIAADTEHVDAGNNTSAQPLTAGQTDDLRQPIMLSDRSPRPSERTSATDPRPSEVHSNAVHPEDDGTPIIGEAETSLTASLAYVDEQIEARWDEDQIDPSPIADDAEWIRRVYLDVVGHIPPIDTIETFLSDTRADKRSRLIDRLLDDPGYVRNWTTVWTNLLIGRANSRDVSRPALQRYLRESFAANRPWSEMVFDFVAAEGRPEERGEANFLLAHLNNEAVPATAITARLFMGIQVQCTQCHDHPFNDWTQNQFWELNSCFQQTKIQRPADIAGMVNARPRATLSSESVGGPIYFETRRGVMRVAYPKFDGHEIDSSAQVNRRLELAKLMITGEKSFVAEAIVNRMWAHFLGYGFTREVDDMGPHSVPTHPGVLDHLAREFVKSGYDLKHLVRTITNSRAYQLTSRFNDSNGIDDPAAGELPRFSRVYVKSMTAEQVYDSLLVATQAGDLNHTDWDAVEGRRQQWLQQFVFAFNTDENDEATDFEGSIPQALMMMNGSLVREAIRPDRNTILGNVLRDTAGDAAKIERLCLSALSRYPTPRELAMVRKMIRQQARTGPRNQVLAQCLEDVFWAYLNSNEFILIH